MTESEPGAAAASEPFADAGPTDRPTSAAVVRSEPPEEAADALATPSGQGLTRDFLRFSTKLLLNAFVEAILLPLAALAYVSDMVRGRRDRDANFYAVLRLGRRWDHWLRLTRPAKNRPEEPEPLAKSAAAGADQLFASLEHMVVSGDLPRQYKGRVEEWAQMIRDGRVHSKGAESDVTETDETIG